MLPDKQVIDPFPDSPSSGINAGGGQTRRLNVLLRAHGIPIACQHVGPGYGAATLMVWHNTVRCTVFSYQIASPVAKDDGVQREN